MADWFPDGKVNVSHLALDAQINAGRGDQVALYYDSPVTNKQVITPIANRKKQSPTLPERLKRKVLTLVTGLLFIYQ